MTILTPGQSSQPNPLLVLAKSLDGLSTKLAGHLAQISENTRPKHVYAVTQVDQGWALYCLGCSELQDKYVFPCVHHDPDKPLPPAGFSVDPGLT